MEDILIEDFTVIHISTDSKTEAYRLFQVLNDRGISLTDGDLLRARTLELLDNGAFETQQTTAETEWVVYRKSFNFKVMRIFTKRFFRKVKAITSTNRYHIDFVINHFLSNNPLIFGKKIFAVIPNTSISTEISKNESIGISKKFSFLKDKYTFLTLGRMEYPGYIEKNFSRANSYY